MTEEEYKLQLQERLEQNRAAHEARRAELAQETLDAQAPSDGGATWPSWLTAAVPGGVSASFANVPDERKEEAFMSGVQDAGRKALAFGTNAAETATFNLGDDLLNLGLAAAEPLLGEHGYLAGEGVDTEDMSFMDRYEMLSDMYNEEQAAITEAAPGVAVAGDITGAIAGLPGKAAAKLFSKFPDAGTLAQSILGAGVGAGEGFLFGLGDDKSAKEVVVDTVGGMLGGGLGVPITKGAAAVGAAVTNSKAGKLALEFLENAAQSPLAKDALKKSRGYLDQGREAIDNASEQISNMQLGTTRESAAQNAKEKLVPLQERVVKDINQGVDELNLGVKRALGLEDADIQSKIQRQDEMFMDAKHQYDDMIGVTQTFTADYNAVQRAINRSFWDTVGGLNKSGVLTGRSQKLLNRLNKNLNKTRGEQVINNKINVPSLIQIRKDIAELMRVKDPGKLGNAYPALAATVDRLDKLIDNTTGGLYSAANHSYEMAHSFQRGMDDGKRMFKGTQYNADDIDYMMGKYPDNATAREREVIDMMNEGRRAGFAQAMLDNSDQGVTKMLTGLLGDGVHANTLNQYKLDKLEAMFPGSTDVLLDVYRAQGPRIDSLVKLYDVINQRIAQPQSAAAAQRTVSDRAQLMHGALTKGLGATSSPAFVGAMSRTFSPVEPTGLTPQASELFTRALNAQGDMFQRRIGRLNTQADIQSLLEQAPAAGAVGGAGLLSGDVPYKSEAIDMLSGD